nr:subtilisin-like protease SBT1.9 [Tanacetum cinerariifolium]
MTNFVPAPPRIHQKHWTDPGDEGSVGRTFGSPGTDLNFKSAYGSEKEDSPFCDVPGFKKSKMKLIRHVSFVDCPLSYDHYYANMTYNKWAPRSQERGRRDNYRQGSKAEEQDPKALMAIDEVGWDWSYMANDEEDHALVADEVAPIEFALMANTSAESKKLKTLKEEKEGVDGKLAGLLAASNDLDNLIESQRSDKNKEGLGYSVVPLPPAQLYLSPKKDLSCTGLPKCVDDTVTDYSRPSPTVESTSGDDQNRNPFVSETVPSQITPKPFIKFVKPKYSQSKSKTGKTESPKKPPVKKRVKKSFTPKPIVYRPYKPSQRPVRTNMNGARPNRTYFNKQAHSYANRPFYRTSAVRSHHRAPWVSTVNKSFPPVNRKFSTSSRNFPTANRKFPTANRKFPTSSIKCSTADMGMKGKAVKPSAKRENSVMEYIQKVGKGEPKASIEFHGTHRKTKPARRVASYSSRGLTYSVPSALKLDLTAPGSLIIASWPDWVSTSLK